jgi:hypothetical protein
MEVAVAEDLARERHAGQRDRFGRPLIEHVERVAERVPPRVQALAWLHDVLERTETRVDELRSRGLLSSEETALQLLTRAPGEAFELYLLRIVHAPGLAGEFARVVKVADLEDHVEDHHQGRFVLGAPPYRWGLRHLLGRPAPAWTANDHWFAAPAPAQV